MSNDKLYDKSGQKLTPVVIKQTLLKNSEHLKNATDSLSKLVSLEHKDTNIKRVNSLTNESIPIINNNQKLINIEGRLDIENEEDLLNINELDDILYKAVLESSDNLLNQEVVFPISNFNELTLEPPKSGEDVPSVDLNKLAQKLNEIENDSENQDIKLVNNIKFINQSNLEFTNISSEQYRIYEFNNGKTIMIVEPLRLNVSKNGGHRIYDNSGMSHYIPQGWIHLSWRAKPNQPNFVK